MTSRLYTLTKPVRYLCRRDVRLSSSWSLQSRNPDELKNRTCSNLRALHVPASSYQPIRPRLTLNDSFPINQTNWGRQISSLTIQSTEVKDEDDKDEDDTMTYDGVSARAKVKMNVLNDAKSIADKAKALYQSSKSSTTELSPESLENIRKNWVEKEVELADAYSKGIKYIARLRTKDVSRKAQLLLDDMLTRHGTINEESTFLPGHDGPQFSDKTVFDLLHAIEQDSSRKSDAVVCGAMRDGIPVPDMKDFSNVLHSWASSKVKRKGVYAESLLYRMMELGYFYPENFSMPDSKTFGLIVKCYAGSTFRDSHRSIQRLHKVHEKLADMNILGIVKNDPFLLMHSIKSISNYTDQEETALVDDWFTRLHKNVMDKSKKAESNEHPADAESESEAKEAMDLTGTYTNIIRGYSKSRQDAVAAEKAFHALQRMQALSALDSEVATIDLKVTIFNVVLSTADSSNDSKILLKKLELLNSMIEGSRGSNEADWSTPMPTDQSFASCIKSLSAMTDPVATMKETEKLMASFESMKEGSIPLSPKPYNAAIELYLNMFGRDEDAAGNLLSLCDDICKRMQNFTPRIHPDRFTSLALLKACAYDDGIMDNQVQRMERAAQIFKDCSSGDNEGSELNDKFYFYMMKCVANSVASAEDRKDQMKELFSKACSGGFVSANVLKMLRTHTSTEEYIQIVGAGRLADNWIANVTSGVAVYTDGTTGGEGKNARRKGKSTSNWAKKQREREEEMLSRKQAKAEKKRLKTKREEKGKRRRL